MRRTAACTAAVLPRPHVLVAGGYAHQLEHRLPCRPCESAEELAMVQEVGPQHLRSDEDPLSMSDLLEVPFTPGRTDVSAEVTDEESFAFLRPMTEGFRNYVGAEHFRRPEVELVDRANQLTLAAPEMTVLVGGMRTLGANFGGSSDGVFTLQTGVLTNEWSVNTLSMDTMWKKSDNGDYHLGGHDRETGELKYTATSVDLVFGSNSQLHALAEVCACDDASRKFVEDFVPAWNKKMMLDRFDLG